MALYEMSLSLDDSFDDGTRDEETVHVTFKRNDVEFFYACVRRADEDDEFEQTEAVSADTVPDEQVLNDLAKAFVKAVKALKEAN